MSEKRATIVLIVTTLLAAFGWVFSKQTIQGLPPFGFIGLRFTIASLCLLPLCFRHLRSAKSIDLLRAALTGCLLSGSLMCWIYAISISDTLGEGAFIVSLSMLLVPVVAWILFRQRPPRAFWLSLPVALIGLAFLSLSGGWQQSSSQLWFMGCATMLALHFNVNSLFSQRLPVLLLTCIQLMVVGMVGMIMSLLFETLPREVPNAIWGWFAMSALLATSLRYVMQTLGQKHIASANAALIMILEPVWTVILSVLWYQEQLSANKIIGCVLILLALLLYRTGGRLARLKFR